MMSMKKWRAEMPGRESLLVAASDGLGAVQAAAKTWGVNWTEIAKQCSVQLIAEIATAKDICSDAGREAERLKGKILKLREENAELKKKINKLSKELVRLNGLSEE